MKAKFLNQLPSGLITSHKQNEKLEQIRKDNPEHLDYENTVNQKIRISSEEKRTHAFIRECRSLLREFGISYDYDGEDFIIEWTKNGYTYIYVIGYQEFHGEDDTCHVWSYDYEENFFSSDNALDCINYVYAQM